MSKGVFIVFEGIDRSGKSTLLSRVADELSKLGLPVRRTREPGGSSMGEVLRPLLLSAKSNPVTESLLFAAERSAHVAEVIKPGLENNEIVLCDRFEASTLAYQGYWRGQDLNKLLSLSQYASGNLSPDLTIWCSIDTEIAASRRELSPDELDAQAVNASNIIAEGFKEIFKNYQEDKIMVIDTSTPVSTENVKLIVNAILEKTNKRKGKLIVISGPSGSGKNSLVDHLLKESKNAWYSVSVTTRPPRINEIEGVDYKFITDKEFDDMLAKDDLLESAEYAGYRYGTPRGALIEKINSGVDVYAVLELKGAIEVKKKISDSVTIFITPPSQEALTERLRKRNTESDTEITNRLNEAATEMELGPSVADYTICNDDFISTIENIKTLLKN